MRNLKRALSLALASVMLMGMMVVGSSAASFPDVSSEDNTEAIAVLEAVKVMIGNENGEFEPDKNVTRNEMAVIMAKLILGTYEADSYVGSHPFTDVPDWAQRYVAACYSAGIIAGRGEGIYDGNSTVTAVEAAAMMLRALGYEDLSLGAAQWDQPVAAKANEINLFDGLSGAGNAPMNRNTVAKLALNTLQATMVTTSRSGQDISLPDGTTIVSARNYNERTTSVYNYTQSDGKYVSGEDNKLQLCEFLYGRDLTLTDSTDGLGRTTDLWQYKGDDVAETAKEAWKSMVINPDDAATIGNVATSKDYFDLKASNVDASVEYKLNGDGKTASEVLKSGDVVELFREDNKVNKVIVTRYNLAQVSKVDDDVSSADAKDGAAYYVSLKGLNGTSKGTYNDNDFAGFNAADYTEDTFVAIAQNGESEIVASHPAKVVEGKVTAYKANKVITLDGDKYNLVNALDAGSVTSFDFDNSEFALYMTENDYVLAIDGVEGVKLDDVYYVHSAYYTQSGNGLQKFYAQVVDMEGVESEIEIEATTYANTFNLDEENPNSFGAVQKLYTFTDKDNKNANNQNANGDSINNKTHITNVPDPKANNGKFSAKKYVDNADFEVASAGSNALDTLAAEVNSSSKTVKVTTGGFGAGDTVKSAYINENTKFILISTNATNATTAELDISTSVGSAKVATGKKAFVIASKEGSSYEAAAVIVADTGVSDGVNSDKVLYLDAKPTVETKGGYEATVYLMDGTKEDVVVDNDSAVGFYTYDINKDGVYELGAIPGNVNVTGSNYDDETGVIAANVIVSIRRSQYITFTGADAQNGKLENITLSEDLQVVDVRSGRENHAYTQKITDLSKLEAAMDRGPVTAMAYVDDGEVKLISVTAMADTRSSDNTVASAEAKQTAGNSKLTATCTVEDGTIRVAVTGSPADGDKITVTPTLTNNKATSTGAVVLTYTTSWDTKTITVTAENGSKKTYTVTTAAAPVLNDDAGLKDLEGVFADSNTGGASLADIAVTSSYTGTTGAVNVTFGAVTGTLENGDTITITAADANLNGTNAALGENAKEIVFTWGGSSWAAAGSIKVTTEKGTVVTYSGGTCKSTVNTLKTDVVNGVADGGNKGTYTGGTATAADAGTITVAKPTGTGQDGDTMTFTMVPTWSGATGPFVVTITYSGTQSDWTITPAKISVTPESGTAKEYTVQFQ